MIFNLKKNYLIKANTLIFISLIVGLLFVPTSTEGVIHNNDYLRLTIISVSIISLCLLNGNLNKVRLMFFFTIQIIFIFFTIYAQFKNLNLFTWNLGSYFLVTFLTFLLMYDFDNGIKVKRFNLIFTLLNLIVILWGLATIFNYQFIEHITLKYYSQFANWSVPNMLKANKPIYSFGIHSYSALFTFVMLVLNLLNIEKHIAKKCVFIVIYSFILIMIKSTTSIILLIFSLLVILYIIYTKNKGFFSFLVLSILILISFGWLMNFITPFININWANYDGFQSRYAGNNMFSGTLNYINEFWGIGILRPVDSSVILFDSGILNFILKGNVFLVLSFYCMLYIFLNKNLQRFGLIIFISFVSFEIGASFFAMDDRASALLMLIIIVYKNEFIEENKENENESRLHKRTSRV